VNPPLGALDLVRQLLPLSRQRQEFISHRIATRFGSLPLKASRLGSIFSPLAHAGISCIRRV
jgi:hypothetical protein